MGPVILVLGGTGFVGRAIAGRLLAGGHAVTVFNRGTRPAPPGAHQLVGDRDTGDYTSLKDTAWDATVDATGYLPRHVGQAIDALGARAGRYLFVSSHVVFDGAGPGLRPAIRDAEYPLTNETYGPSKVACEQDVTAFYGPKATLLRLCKVAGPGDNQRGLCDWVRRAAEGGRIELPGDPEQPVQLVDVQDVAELAARLLAEDRGGAFTAAGPVTPFGELIMMCARIAGVEAEVVPVAAGDGPLVKQPGLWNTQHRVPAAGMRITPIEETIRRVRTIGS